MRFAIGVLVGLWLLPTSVMALDFRGEIGVEHRQFFRTPIYDDARDEQPSIALQGQWFLPWGERSNFDLTVFGRLDAVDSERRRVDLREAKWVYMGDSWDFTAGYALVYWGVVESQRLVDVINQRDPLEDITGNVRLGQPMLHGRYFAGAVTYEAFVMPWFRERPFASSPARLRLPLEVDTGQAEYESSQERRHIDLALRSTFTLGTWDAGLHVFRGTNREPELRLSEGQDFLFPFYEQMTQFGVDIQRTVGSTLWKFEGIYRSPREDSYFAYAAGLEHAFYQVFESNIDVSILLEHNWDERGDDATTPYQNDLFTGVRIVMGDVAGTEALIGVYNDLDYGGRFGRLQASRRFGNNLRGIAEAYWFSPRKEEDAIYPYRREDHIIVGLDYFFEVQHDHYKRATG
ncbi:hypothetical protein CAI21_12565 [Alkalilimnicola ehrlichii]|uniref:hypothetical protein n=1 Tax=Alkalilimnicola ehrlichii TaxID=351052 RepID=UPI000E2FC744|nr:hypothetical protein [Alkalilimnicola ehrlichii]RFA28396.1 hypothetical protein CAI21_12565 [Alkalilimnicola ehrlichii]